MAVIVIKDIGVRARRKAPRFTLFCREKLREVKSVRLRKRVVYVEEVRAPDRFFEGVKPKCREVCAGFFREKPQEVDDVLRLAREMLPKTFFLSCNPDRASIAVATAILNAPECHEQSRTKAKLFRTEERTNNHIAPRLDLSIDLDLDASAQVILHEGLLSLGKPQFPREPRVLHRSQWRGTRAAIIARDQHHIRVRLRDTCRDSTDPRFGNEFHRNSRGRIRALKVINELCQILN